MIQVPLTQGYVAILDDAEESLARHKWYAGKCNGKVYARRTINRASGNVTVYLHKEVLGVGSGTEVDHVDSDTMNCRRQNLRIATHAENGKNRKLNANNPSGYKGVRYRSGKTRPWNARIKAKRETEGFGVLQYRNRSGCGLRRCGPRTTRRLRQPECLTRTSRSGKVRTMNDATCYTGSPSFDAAVNAFMSHAQAACDENMKQYLNIPSGPRIEAMVGPKYIRIVRAETFGSGRSAYCFIDRENGNVLFPKSWASPSKKTPRGTVYRSETFTCAGPHGVAYLRK